MLDFDGDGALTAADLELHRASLDASQRATGIAQILSGDLDGDGIVTRAEVTELVSSLFLQSIPAGQKPEMEARLREQIEAEVTKRMSPDLNGDGRIDGSEMLTLAKTAVARFPIKLNPMLAVARAFDQNQDGQTSLAEFLNEAERVFRQIDADGDGMISKQEIAEFRKQTTPPP
jgi:Ca2+-binding EF-hand superfamily protein